MANDTALDERGWLPTLSLFALVAGLAYLVLFVLFFFELPLTQNSSLPDAYNDLLLAARSPVLARLSVLLSTAYWLMIGCFFTIAGRFFSRVSPIPGVFIMAIGGAQLLGVLGNVLQMNTAGDLAARYAAAAPAQQTALLESFSVLRLAYTSAFEASGLLWAAGLLLAGSVAWLHGVFPRWWSALTIFAGLVALGNFVVILASAKYDAPVVAELLLMVVFFATAIGLWRYRPPSSAA